MKKLTFKEWEDKYNVEEVKPFDQKNHMFIRPLWDAVINRLLDDWSFIGPVKRETSISGKWHPPERSLKNLKKEAIFDDFALSFR